MKEAAHFDPLTQAFGRSHGLQTLEKWLDDQRAFSIGFVDIDGLKDVNGRFGRAEGDKYIIRTAFLLHRFSFDAVLCRLGGGEFLLMAPNWTERAAEERLEALRGKLLQFDTGPDRSYRCSFSYGVIGVDAPAPITGSGLLAAADRKMYEYKARRR